MYVSRNEGANFWLSVLTDLQNRGVEDILIACIDGLKGFPEAIQSVYPNTAVQLCVVHQIRNSIKYVGSKNQKEFLKDLKCVYRKRLLNYILCIRFFSGMHSIVSASQFPYTNLSQGCH